MAEPRAFCRLKSRRICRVSPLSRKGGRLLRLRFRFFQIVNTGKQAINFSQRISELSDCSPIGLLSSLCCTACERPTTPPLIQFEPCHNVYFEVEVKELDCKARQPNDFASRVSMV